MAKPTARGGWRDRSTRYLAAIAAVVLVLVLVTGMGIGYLVERNHVSTSKKASTPTTRPRAAAAKALQFSGTVNSATANAVKVKLKNGRIASILLTRTAVISKASTGAAGDIAPQSKVAFVAKGPRTVAKEILVLPRTAKFGTPVAAAAAGTMTLRVGAKQLKITTTGAVVDKAAASTRSELKSGAKVILRAVRMKTGAMVALEIVVLPSGSAFA